MFIADILCRYRYMYLNLNVLFKIYNMPEDMHACVGGEGEGKASWGKYIGPAIV